MKKCILSFLLLACCRHTYTKWTQKEIIHYMQEFITQNHSSCKVEEAQKCFLKLCDLATSSNANADFTTLKTNIDGQHSQKEIIDFYNKLQEKLPNDAAWTIYGAVADAERITKQKSPSGQAVQQEKKAAAEWKKCLTTTSAELKKNVKILSTKHDIKCAVAKLVEIKVRAEDAQPLKSPR